MMLGSILIVIGILLLPIGMMLMWDNEDPPNRKK